MATVKSLIAQPSKPFCQNISIALVSAACRSKVRGLPTFFGAAASTESVITFLHVSEQGITAPSGILSS
ncbi:hypothetical protein [Paraburkholderia sp. DHOC27]|uniref:hypothetical protein n=1 Tax=Paraburkholderia sp. DHOC27 TaxID=2303330 RepID=UPI00216AC34C|nr:hypothetical protein [Paraburkholderia sp. DHOC27]